MRAVAVTVWSSLLVVAATATAATRLRAAANTLRAEQRRLQAVAMALEQQEQDGRRRRAELATEQDAQMKLSATLGAQRPASLRELMNRGLAELDRPGNLVRVRTATLPLRQSKAGKMYFPELLGRPGYAEAAATVERVHVEGTYGPLIASLGLSPDGRRRLVDLLLDREMTRQDLIGLDPAADADAVKRRKVDLVREWRPRVQAAFGPDVPRQIEAFDRSLRLHAAVDELAARVSFTATPLSSQQAGEVFAGLTSIMGTTVRSRYWAIPDEAIARLESVLSSEQIAALTQIQEEQRATIEARDERAGGPRSP